MALTGADGPAPVVKADGLRARAGARLWRGERLACDAPARDDLAAARPRVKVKVEAVVPRVEFVLQPGQRRGRGDGNECGRGSGRGDARGEHSGGRSQGRALDPDAHLAARASDRHVMPGPGKELVI